VFDAAARGRAQNRRAGDKGEERPDGRTSMTATSQARTARGWYHGWTIVAATILAQVAANGLTYNAFSLFLRDWSAQLHAPISELQLAVAGMVLVAALASPAVGALVDKRPARPIFACGLLGMAVFYVAVSFAQAAWQLLALYALLAPIALCLSTAIPCNAVISRWFVRRRGLALGLSAFGIGMAGVVLPPLVAALAPALGWRLIWRYGGLLLAVVVTPLVVPAIRDRPGEREGFHYLQGDGGGAQQAHGHGRGGSAGSGLSWRDVASRRNFWLLVGIYLPMLALNGGCNQNLAPFAASHGWSQQSAGLLLSVLSVSHLVATFVLGLVSDRFGNRLPFVGLALVMAAGAVVFAFAASLPAAAVGAALIGFGGGVYILLAAGLAAEFGAEGFGRAYGLAMLFVPAISVAPFGIARLQETSGGYAPGFLTFGALVLVSGGLALLLRERRGGGGGDLRTIEAEVAEETIGRIA
jgi:MFS family permease